MAILAITLEPVQPCTLGFKYLCSVQMQNFPSCVTECNWVPSYITGYTDVHY